MRKKSFLPALCLLLLACLLALAPVGSGPEPSLPPDYLTVPIIRQSTDYSCGAASLLSILIYWKADEMPESELFPLLETDPAEGTHPQSMVDFARKSGLHTEIREKNTLDDLKRALKQGETVILDIQAWRDDPKIAWKDCWDDGHYVVLVGMDSEYVYVMDPSVGSGYAYIAQNELMERWHDWEKRGGEIWKNYQLAIFIRGDKNHLTQYPKSLSKVE